MWLIIQGGLRIGISCSKVERAKDSLARKGSVVAKKRLSVNIPVSMRMRKRLTRFGGLGL